MYTVLGIDPGKSGAYCQISDDEIKSLGKMDTESVDKTATIIKQLAEESDFVCIENVTGWIGFGVKNIPMSTMFTMGFWAGIVSAAASLGNDDVRMVMAAKWQRDLSLDTKKSHGDKWKTYLWHHAKSLYPHDKILKPMADAVLIAHWGRVTNTFTTQRRR